MKNIFEEKACHLSHKTGCLSKAGKKSKTFKSSFRILVIEALNLQYIDFIKK